MSDDELWTHEQRFWMDRAAFCERSLGLDALIVLPRGILQPGTEFAAIDSALPPANIVLSNRHCARPTTHVAVLAYEASTSEGDETTAYRAYCSSTYVRGHGCWVLMAHHQTRLGDYERRLQGVAALRYFFASPGDEPLDDSHDPEEARPRRGLL